MKEEKAAPKEFNEKLLSEKDQKSYDFVKQRIQDLQDVRKQQQFGSYIEAIWADADKDYTPHRLRVTGGKKVIATDEDKGWRGQTVTLGSNEWQSDISQPNPFIKIQIALSILIDQNPTGIFTPASKKYQAITELMKQLYSRSWEYAKSKPELKKFTFNLAKYGWAAARTFPLRLTNKVKNLVSYNQEEPDKSEYEEKEVIEYNDIMRENLDPWNVWIDDMARPNNARSVKDWVWRKVYTMEAAEQEFGKYANWKYVKPGGTTTDRIQTNVNILGRQYKDKDLVEIYFYENRMKDLFEVHAGGIDGVPIIQSPLPISDSKGNKKLSLWQTYWNLRNAECPYGIGLYEAMRYDQGTLDRIRNMTIDQLTLSIYKMFFYQGTQTLTETGDIKITPGVGKQVLDPKNINWLDVPGPGAEAWQGWEQLKKDVDDSSGITDPLLGNITGKTAFEIAQAKEAALKRLKNPLENIIEALNDEAYITLPLIQILYSIPETYQIVDQNLIDTYLNEVQSDPALYERSVGEDGQETFTAKVYPEFPLNLDKDEKGNLIETKETQFFRIKPQYLQWEGIVSVKAQSVLSPSKQVDKALDAEMYQQLIPLFAQPPELYKKIAESIVKSYDKDPKDILPDVWLNPPQVNPQDEPLIIDAAQAQGAGESSPQLNPQATQSGPVGNPLSGPPRPQGIVGKIASFFSKPR